VYPLRALLLALLPTLLLSAAPALAQSAPAQDTSSAQPTDPQLPDADAAALEADDEAALAESEAAPPAAFTGIRGQVVDAETKEPLIEATVKVVAGADAQVLTDLDGNYVLPLPPGKYDLRVFYDVYQGRRITGVEVREGKATQLSVALSGDAAAVQEVVVEARVDKRAEGAVLQERKRAAAVSDAISAQEIARTPDSSASDAVKRVVSATVVDGKYVLLRGLGGRYSSTLLNGAILPSPEPDEQAVPLDIFPTSLLANLNVVKSYTSDLPGTFAGGALLIETNSYPTELELKPRLSLSGDSETTFQDRRAYAGGGREWLGVDDGTRALPAGVPANASVNSLTPAQREQVAESFSNNWTLTRQRALPNLSVGASVGDTVRVGNRRLGYLGSFGYGRKETVQEAYVARLQAGDTGGLVERETANTTTGTQATSLNGLLSMGYQPSRDFELSLLSLFTRTGESRALFAQGLDSFGQNYSSQRLQFVSRQLAFNQLRGFHRLPVAGDMELGWQANYSRVDRDEPDTRDIVYDEQGDAPDRFRSDPGAERYYSALGEDSFGGGLDATLPLPGVRLKLGGMAQLSARDFTSRRFRFFYAGGNRDVLLQQPAELFSPENVGPYIGLDERTRPEDNYRGDLALYAGYATADVSLLEPLRVVAGLRYEVSTQQLEAGSAYAPATGGGRLVDQSYADFLPTLNLVYALGPSVNLRTGYSYTLARPTFRELAPFLYFDFARRRSVSGNPDLVETRIHNVDARAEWFPAESEVLAVSTFYKRFQNPIERVITNVFQNDVGFDNAEGAQAYGVELEARASLGRLASALAAFRAGANLTLVRSRIELGESASVQTSQERPLQGQSPYVLNLNLGYERPHSGTEIALLYNVYGRRISEVGIESIPDVYEQPFHRLDLAVSQKLGGASTLKLTATNLLDQRLVAEQGDLTLYEYRPGVAFSATYGLSF
jgi:outer membrane receptor protein involved in Fe transport